MSHATPEIRDFTKELLSRIKNAPIRKKLLLLLLIIFLPAFGIVAGLGIKQRNHAVREAQNNAAVLTESLAAQQEQIVTTTKAMFSTLADIPEVRRLEQKGCSRVLKKLNEQYPFYSVLAVMTPEGNVFASSLPFEPGTNQAYLKFTKEALRDLDFAAGEFIQGPISKQVSINYAYPVLDPNRHVLAVLAAGFRLDAYRPFVANIKLPEGYYVLLTDWKGVRIFRWPEDPRAPLGQALSSQHFTLISDSEERGFCEWKSPDGLDRIYAFKQMRLREGLPPYLYILVGIPKQRILRQADLHLLGSLSLLGMSTGLAMFLAWSFGDLVLVRPLKLLVTATRHFGAGQLDARTGVPHTADEIGQLARSFDEMASLLEKRNALADQRGLELRATVKQLDSARETAERVALLDPLTQLPNRNLFNNRLTQALELAERTGYPCALLYLDLDRFNVINDSLGHHAGDELLVKVAERLQASLRGTDSVCRLATGEDLVARFGGDEFAILLEGIRDVNDALRVADRIGDRLSRPFHLCERELTMTASIGITTSAIRYRTPEAMLRDADTAMYRAKAAGRGVRAIFDETMHRGSPALALAETRLGLAGGIHSRSRGDGTDRPHRRLGAARSLRSDAQLAATLCRPGTRKNGACWGPRLRTAPFHEREPLGQAVPAPGSGEPSGRDSAPNRAGWTKPAAGVDRDRSHGRTKAHGLHPERTAAAWRTL